MKHKQNSKDKRLRKLNVKSKKPKLKGLRKKRRLLLPKRLPLKLRQMPLLKLKLLLKLKPMLPLRPRLLPKLKQKLPPLRKKHQLKKKR